MNMKDRYAAAEGLLTPLVVTKVRNATLEIRWLGDRICAFERANTDGKEWIVVELASGARRAPTESEKAALSATAPALPHGTSPDGQWRLTQRDGNLWLAAADGEAKQVTTDGSPDDGYAIYHGNFKAGHIPRARMAIADRAAGIVWSPDSRKVIVWRIDQRHVLPYPYLETAPQDGSFRPKLHLPRMPLTGDAPPTIRWYCLDVTSRRLTSLQLPEDQLHLHQDWEAVRTWMWSSDRSHAWCIQFGAQHKAAYLVDVDLATGASRIVISEKDEPRVELNTTLYSQPAVAVVGDLDEVVWYSHRSGFGHLYRYDGKTGALKNAITQGDWLVRDLIDVDAKTGRVLFTAQGKEGGNPYLRSLYSVQLDGSGLKRLTPAGLDADINPGLSAISKDTSYAGHFSPDRKFLSYTRSNVTTKPQTCVLNLTTGSETVLEEADVSALLASGYVPPEEFVTLAADGKTEIHGLLWRPHRLAPGAKAPLIVGQYASPLMAACPRTYVAGAVGLGQTVSVSAHAALGFAVIMLDARGTTGRSRAFATAGQGKLNLVGMDDYVAAIRQLGERHPWLDTDRVGIQGGSYGGFATIRAMIEFPDVFKAGVSLAPSVTMHNMYPDIHWSGWQGEPDFGSEPRGPKSRPVNYEVMDAERQVDRIKGQLLVIAGELDENCPLPPIMQFYAAAVEADAPVELMVLPNRNHWTIARTRHTYRRIMDHFVRHLLNVEPPKDFRFTALPQLPEPNDKPTAW